MGRRTDAGGRIEWVAEIREGQGSGPVPGSMIVVEGPDSATARARYLSWINYHDIELAKEVAPLEWELVEPSEKVVVACRWAPYG